MRRIGLCSRCGKTKVMATRLLCYACYRQAKRAAAKLLRAMGPTVRPEDRRALRGFASVMNGLGELSVAKCDVLAVRQLLEPYLEPIEWILSGQPEENDDPVNGERPFDPEFTVHCFNEAQPAAITSEPPEQP